MTSENRTIAAAVADLGDEHAEQLHACVEVLKTEADLDRRRVAENRYLKLTKKDQAA